MKQPNRQDEFADLMRDDYRRIFAYVLSLVHHFDDAQDIVQETSQTLWEKFDEYDPSRPFCNWAFGVARLKALQHLEKVKRRKESFQPDVVARLAELMDQRPAVHEKSRLDAMRTCETKLTEAQRALLKACYDGTRSVREVAQSLGRPPSSVHNSLGRIRMRLLECIDRTLAEDD